MCGSEIFANGCNDISNIPHAFLSAEYHRSTGHRWIPLTESSDSEFWCFLWSAYEQTIEQTIETLVIWDTIAFIMTSDCDYVANEQKHNVMMLRTP